jgi:hypothetical protein
MHPYRLQKVNLLPSILYFRERLEASNRLFAVILRAISSYCLLMERLLPRTRRAYPMASFLDIVTCNRWRQLRSIALLCITNSMLY